MQTRLTADKTLKRAGATPLFGGESEESVKTQLDQYAKFIDSTPSYVITEALRVLFKRDDEFKAWLGQHGNNQNPEQNQGEALMKSA